MLYKTNNKKPKHEAAIEKADTIILERYFSDSLEDPVKLQEFVWFNLCFHFGKMGCEGWRELLKEYFKILTDVENHRCLTIVLTESTENNPGGHKQSSQNCSDVIMHEVDSHPLNPVNILEFCLQKLLPENPNLFAKCGKLFSKIDEIWYTKEVIRKNTLVNIRKQISGKAGLSQIYLYHCVRVCLPLHIYMKQELMLSKYIPLQNNCVLNYK